MMEVKRGGARVGVNVPFEYRDALVDGAISTNGVQYSSIATVGTVATEVFSKLVDPGYTLSLKKLMVGLTQHFTGLNGSFVGTIMYHWRARSEWYDAIGGQSAGVGTQRVGAWVGLHGTLSKGVGTLTTSEDTLSGNIPVASLPIAPFRLSLMAQGLRAAVVSGKVKSSSIVDLVGDVIPGA
uniref:Uncharacterized protein n=1 Tax=viral metagenome TaxID=1070528 RepID=A0A6M3IEY3_9ZZZZ